MNGTCPHCGHATTPIGKGCLNPKCLKERHVPRPIAHSNEKPAQQLIDELRAQLATERAAREQAEQRAEKAERDLTQLGNEIEVWVDDKIKTRKEITALTVRAQIAETDAKTAWAQVDQLGKDGEARIRRADRERQRAVDRCGELQSALDAALADIAAYRTFIEGFSDNFTNEWAKDHSTRHAIISLVEFHCRRILKNPHPGASLLTDHELPGGKP